jgi:putative transposase
MTRLKRNSTDRADCTTWPTVAWSALPKEQRDTFLAREDAVRRYCHRESLRTIETLTGVKYSSIRRLYERCIQIHEDGRVQGMRALIPFEHVKSYQRNTKIVRPGRAGKAGAFALLLEQYPELERLIINALQQHRVVVRQGKNGLIVTGLTALHKHFRKKCLDVGITEHEYPLVQAEQGVRSLSAAVKAIATQTFEQAARAALAQKRSGGIRPHAEDVLLAVKQPYDAVEFDGHRVDVRLRVVFERVAGVEESFEIDRVWLLTIIDICSRAILGYHIVLEPEFNRYDVLKTVENALIPWKAPELSIPGLRFSAGAGMPSQRLPELGYAVWNWFRFDNARANLAEDTLRLLTEIVGCGAHAGPAYRPNERPHIERFFNTLGTVLTHRLPGTTGVGSGDVRRHLIELTAKTSALVHLDELRELTAVAIANYNASAHEGLGGRSPLETLAYYLREKCIPLRWLAEPMRGHLCLLQHEREGHVRGNFSKGERPYIQFFGAYYTSPILVSRADLVGQLVKIYFDSEDVRALRLFDIGGRELCVVEVQGAWRYTAHTLRMRKEILALVRQRKMSIKNNEDPVQCYLDYLHHGVAKRRRKASKAEIARRAIEKAPVIPKAPPGQPSTKGGTDQKESAPTAVAINPPMENAAKPSTSIHGKKLVIGTGQVFSR